MTPRRRPRGARPTVGVALVVAALTLAACASGGSSGGSSSGPAGSAASPAASGPSGLVGPTWQVVHVHDGTVDVDVPTTLGADVTLQSDGTFVAHDSVNTVSGHYTLTPTGFTPSDAVSTLIGSTATDPVQTATISAVVAVCNADRVTADISGDALTLTTGSTTVELRTSP